MSGPVGHRFRPPSARSLLLTMLGEYVLPGSGAAWAGTMVDALGLVGVEEKAARQAIARTASDGWLEGSRDGRRVRWRLTDASERLLTEGARRIYTFGAADGDGEPAWVVVLVRATDLDRTARRRLRTQLTWAGFGSPVPGVWISPHGDREEEARRAVAGLGLDGDAVSFVGRPGRVGDVAALARETWDLAAIERRYRAFIAEHGRPVARVPARAFVRHTRLVHSWRRFPFLDPGLPTHLVPAGWAGTRAHAVFRRRYDEGVAGAREWWRDREGAP